MVGTVTYILKAKSLRNRLFRQKNFALFWVILGSFWAILRKVGVAILAFRMYDPGVSGVLSMGPGVSMSVQELCETLLM